LSQRTFDDYKTITDRIVEAFGLHRLVEDLRPENFEQLRARMAKGSGLSPWRTPSPGSG
jgi:hypothetical protein